MEKKFFILLLLCSICITTYAQDYVVPRKNEIWGANEKVYADYGKKALTAMKADSYSLAAEHLRKMTTINAKNVNRKLDYLCLCRCYLNLWDADKYILASRKYVQIVGTPKNRTDSLDLCRILTNQAAFLYEKEQYQEALLSLEKSNSMILKVDNYDLISLCYENLGNMFLAKKNRIIAIAIESNKSKVNIYDIETKGIDNPFLGQMFYDYRRLLPKTDASYHDFIYLSYLAAKCNLPEAVQEQQHLLKAPEIVVKNRELFKLK